MQLELDRLSTRPVQFLQISPVVATGEGATVEICELGMEDGFALFGMDGDTTALIVYEAIQIEEVVRVALLAHRAFGNAVRWHDPEKTTTHKYDDFAAVAEDMACAIHEAVYDELDPVEHDDLERRADAFEEHPLSAVRDAFCDYSDYNGFGTCRDPLLPVATT